MKKIKALPILLISVGLAGALYPFISWLLTISQHPGASQDELRNYFYKRLPNGFEQTHIDIYLMPAFAAMAILGCVLWVKRSSHSERIIAIILLVLSCVLGFLSIFQLM